MGNVLMRAVRTTRRKFSVRDSRGAALRSGRWHHEGQSILYCGSSLSLAVLEQRANTVPFDELREEFHFADIEIVGVEIERAPEACYEGDWTADLERTRDFGTAWSKSRRSLVLEVRSAVLPVESNYLINTAHPDFAKVAFSEPRAIPLDDRL
jgi:RES domain-containing protein